MKPIIKIFLIFIFVSTTVFCQTNEKIELEKISFQGNDFISSGDLIKAIYSQETPWWFWKFLNSFTNLGAEPVYFDSTLIQSDIEALKGYYIANGFFRAAFDANYQIDSVEKTASLVYNINEGPASNFGKISFSGLEKIPNEIKTSINSKLTLDTLKRYTQVLIQENIDHILVVLENNGYMLAGFDSTLIIKDTLNNKADVTVFFQTGNSFIIDSLRIETSGEGSQYVEKELLRDIVGLKKYDTYNIDRIRQSQVRLYRTGLFSSVFINPVVSDTFGNFVPIHINGTIGLLNEFAPEIVLNNQQNSFNAGLGGIFTRKNFLGNARKLSFTGQFGLSDFFRANFYRLPNKFFSNDTTVVGYIEAKIRLEQPYIFSRPIFGILDAYGATKKDLNLFTYTLGGKLSFEFELPSYTFINFLTAYYNLEYIREVYSSTLHNLQLRQTLSILGAELKSSKTDNPLFPTKGYNLSLLFEDANVIPYLLAKISNRNFVDALFYKIQISSAFYLATTQRKFAVLGLKFKTGYIHPYGGSEYTMPSARRFFVGGSNSVRGWKARTLNPSYIISTRQNGSGSTHFIEGGKFMIENSVEYRYRFFEDFGAAFFLDYGNAWENPKVFRFDEVALAIGTGLRYYTAIAPFRIDFGFKVYDPNNRRSFFKKSFWDQMEFHFGIGEAF